VKSWVRMESRRVLPGRSDFWDVRCVFIGLWNLRFYNVFVIKHYMMRGFPVSFHERLTFVHDSGSAFVLYRRPKQCNAIRWVKCLKLTAEMRWYFVGTTYCYGPTCL